MNCRLRYHIRLAHCVERVLVDSGRVRRCSWVVRCAGKMSVENLSRTGRVWLVITTLVIAFHIEDVRCAVRLASSVILTLTDWLALNQQVVSGAVRPSYLSSVLAPVDLRPPVDSDTYRLTVVQCTCTSRRARHPTLPQTTLSRTEHVCCLDCCVYFLRKVRSSPCGSASDILITN